MDQRVFDQSLEALRQRIENLLHYTEAPSVPLETLSAEAIEQLGIAAEELQVAAEELRQQNAQLVETQRQLELEHQRYQELFHFAPDCYLITDAEGTIQEANRAAALLFNRPQAVLKGKPMVLLVADGDHALFYTQLSALQQTNAEALQTWELRMQRWNGSPFPAGLTVATVRSPQDKLIGLRWLIRDIAHRKRAEEQIRKLNEDLEQRVVERTRQLQVMTRELEEALIAQKEVERELRESETVTRLLLDSAGEGIYGIDVHGRCTFINKAAAKMLGYRPDEVQGKSMHPLIHHSRSDGTPKPYEGCRIYGAFRSGQSCHVDDEVFWRQDGTAFSAEYMAYPIRENDTIRGAVVTFTDITERKRTEQKLQESEERLRLALHAVDIGIWDWNIRANEVTWSDNVKRLFGLMDKPFDGTYEAFLDLVHPDDRKRLVQAITRCLEEKVEYEVEHRIIWPNGSLRWLTCKGDVLRDDAGKAVRMLGTVMDITERKRSEEALRAIEARQALILSSLPMAFYTAVPSGDFGATWVSDSIASLTGFSPRAFVDQRHLWVERLHPDDQDRVLQEFEQMVEKGAISAEYRWQIADGSYRWFLDSAVCIRDLHGEPLELIGAWLDITERKQVETQLKESREQLRSLAARVESVREEERIRIAREIHDELGGQALTALKLDVAWLNKRLSQWGDAIPLSTLKTKLDGMSNILDTTMHTVRRIATELRPVVLDDLGLIAAIEWQTREFQMRTHVTCDLQVSVRRAEVDEPQSTAMFRIFQELLINVARHANATAVKIHLYEQAGHLVLDVKDNGRGITHDELSNPKALGLLGMRERASFIGGAITISGVPGEGTTVTVRVPIR